MTQTAYRLPWMPRGLVFTLLLGACGSPPVDPAREESSVRAAWEALATAIEAEDWAGFQALWIQDATVQVAVPAGGAWLQGWAQVSEVYRDVVAAGSRLDFETVRLEIRIDDSGRTAWAVGEVITTTGASRETSWQMAVLRKVGDEWRFAAALTAPVSGATEG